ncbi:MAG: peptidylprolyl isomerase, partial [Crinalium sp.]
GLVFHRVVREPQPFVVQGGDPQGKDPKFPQERLGTGGFIDPATNQQRYIPLEIKPRGATSPIYSQTFNSAGISDPPVLKHTRGALAMARSQDPDSASSQFYIALADLAFLDGDYAVFGNVTDGMSVVDKIQQGDRIDSAKVTQGIENLKKPQ